jgi:hypothetical protein
MPVPARLFFEKSRSQFISPRELRRFLGDPKASQWKALLERAGVVLKWRQGTKRRRRRGLTRAQVFQVLKTRYGELGEKRIRRWGL